MEFSLKIKMRFLALLLIIYCLNCNAQERVYSSNKSISFVPIKNWENHSDNDNIIFSQPKKGILDAYKENIRISEFPSHGFNLEQTWKTFVLRDFPKSFKKYKEIKKGKDTIDGNRANWIMFSNVTSNSKYINLIYMMKKNDAIYFITCLAQSKNFESTRLHFMKMIKSILIK